MVDDRIPRGAEKKIHHLLIYKHPSHASFLDCKSKKNICDMISHETYDLLSTTSTVATIGEHTNPCRFQGSTGDCKRGYYERNRCGDRITANISRRKMLRKRSYQIHFVSLWALLTVTVVSVSSLFPFTVDASTNGGNNDGAHWVMSEMMVPVTMSEMGDENSVDQGASDAGDDNNNVSGDSSDEVMRANDTANVNTFEESSIGKSIAEINSTGGSGGSDTDGEDEEDQPESSSQSQVVNTMPTTSTSTPSVSQPLKTLKKLQAMLDDSDYATSAVTPSSVVGESHNLDNDVGAFYSDDSSSSVREAPKLPFPLTEPPSNAEAASSQDKLWTSKDRAKYRRTRRTEKQRQQYEEQRAREFRDMQRQRIIRQERERKELEELRRKQMEVVELQRREQEKRKQMMQQQLMQFDETDFTDDDTDTDGKSFELPNVPVYFSDGETDDFSEEGDDLQEKQQRRPNRPQGMPYNPQRDQQYQMPYQMAGRPHQYPEYSQTKQQQRSPPQPAAYHQYPEYRQPPPPPPQMQEQQQQHQSRPYSSYLQQPSSSQYQLNPQQIHEQRRLYEQQYAAWAQAASNGYYYPPPTYPLGSPALPQQNNHHQQSLPQYSFPNQQQNMHQNAYSPPLQHQHQTQSQPMQSARQHPPVHPSQQHASRPPPSQASQAVSNNQGSGTRGFFTRGNDVVQLLPFGSHQQITETTPNVQQVDNYEVAPLPVSGGNKQLLPVGSADVFASPMSPLVSSVPARLMAPINAEGPYSELKDESVSLESHNAFHSIL